MFPGMCTETEQLRPMMERLGSKTSRMSEHVVFEGVVNYSELPSVFGTAKYFVGMGTAALEASLVGVPGVYALAFKDDGSSCGTICESDIGNFDELAEMPSDRNIGDELVRLLDMDEAEYLAESERVRACAMKSEESVVMPKLLVAFECRSRAWPDVFLVPIGAGDLRLREESSQCSLATSTKLDISGRAPHSISQNLFEYSAKFVG